MRHLGNGLCTDSSGHMYVICAVYWDQHELLVIESKTINIFVPTFNLDLNRKLKEKMDKEIPVITVVAITGTTEQSAVDPVNAIVHLRGKFRTKVRITWTLYDFISEILATVFIILIMIVPIFVVSWIIFDITSIGSLSKTLWRIMAGVQVQS